MNRTLVGVLFGLMILFCSCLPIRKPFHNPKKHKPYPAFSEEVKALGSLNEFRTNYDVHHYELDIELLPEETALKGWVAIGAVANRNADTIQIDLDQRLKIHSIRWKDRDGLELQSYREHRAVLIRLPSEVEPKDEFVIHVQYSGMPMEAKMPPWAGGLVWKKDNEGFDFAGVACETEGASIWFPCKDHTSDEPDSADLHFSIADSQLMVVSNGKLQSTSMQDGKYRYSWKVSNPINVYNISFYLGNYGLIEDQYESDNGLLEINHYVRKPNLDTARQHFQQAKEHIRVYEEIFGPYPWYEDGFKLVESPYAGMEHQSAIAYGNGFRNDLFGKDDFIILHEIGHEWFGNAVTAEDLADVWLQEGFTTYGEVLYLEKRYGTQTANKLLFQYAFQRNQRPLVGPRDRRFFDYRDSDVYHKGAWVLHSLRSTLDNDSIFFSIIRQFYEQTARKTTNSQQFIDLVQKITKEDYGWFFDQFLYDRRIPILEYYLDRDGWFYYRWTSTHPRFQEMPVRVWLDKTLVEILPSPSVQRLDLGCQFGKINHIQFDKYFTLHGSKSNPRLASSYK